MYALPETLIDLLQIDARFLIASADFYLKSAFLFLLACYLDWNASPFFTSAQKRLLWMVTFAVLAILPLIAVLVSSTEAGTGGQIGKALWVVATSGASGQESDTVQAAGIPWSYIGATVYLTVVWFGFLKLGLSFRQVALLRKSTDYNVPAHGIVLCQRLCRQQGISQPVRLGVNRSVDSPLTFGVGSATIVLPGSAYFADEELLRNVLLHELGHIKRRDTLLFTVAHALATLNWFNPFVRFALQRLDIESEFACDDDVLTGRKDSVGFASQLLGIAREGLGRRSVAAAERAMVKRGQLSRRIEHVLQFGVGSGSARTYSSWQPVAMLVLTAVLFSNYKVVAAGDENSFRSEDVRLLRYFPPDYPDDAYNRNISGFAQYEFTVTAEGRVDMQSLKMIRSSPAGMFMDASEQALANFEFAPRRINGRTVTTERVRYTFNYTMQF